VIAHDIGLQIVSGRYRPGDVLHGEIETSGRLHVSRAAYVRHKSRVYNCGDVLLDDAALAARRRELEANGGNPKAKPLSVPQNLPR
jgi:hypothetical protein